MTKFSLFLVLAAAVALLFLVERSYRARYSQGGGVTVQNNPVRRRGPLFVEAAGAGYSPSRIPVVQGASPADLVVPPGEGSVEVGDERDILVRIACLHNGVEVPWVELRKKRPSIHELNLRVKSEGASFSSVSVPVENKNQLEIRLRRDRGVPVEMELCLSPDERIVGVRSAQDEGLFEFQVDRAFAEDRIDVQFQGFDGEGRIAGIGELTLSSDHERAVHLGAGDGGALRVALLPAEYSVFAQSGNSCFWGSLTVTDKALTYPVQFQTDATLVVGIGSSKSRGRVLAFRQGAGGVSLGAASFKSTGDGQYSAHLPLGRYCITGMQPQEGSPAGGPESGLITYEEVVVTEPWQQVVLANDPKMMGCVTLLCPANTWLEMVRESPDLVVLSAPVGPSTRLCTIPGAYRFRVYDYHGRGPARSKGPLSSQTLDLNAGDTKVLEL